MFRFVLRLVGLLLLAGAFAALIVDGTRSVAAGKLSTLPLGRLVADLAPDAFVKLHAGIETHAPMLWDPVLVTILLMPIWVVFGAVGLLILALTRRPAPKIGYSRR